MVRGYGTMLAYKWRPGFNIGHLGNRPDPDIVTEPVGTLNDEWHTLQLWAQDGQVSGQLDTGPILTWTGDFDLLDGFTMSGDEHKAWFINTLTLHVTTADPTISVTDTSVLESEGQAAVPVSLSHAADQSVSVNYATSDNTAVAGEDYAGVSGTLVWEPGESGEQLVAIPLIDDPFMEDDESLNLTLSDPFNAEILTSTATVTILNDDDDEHSFATRGIAGDSGPSPVVSISVAPEADIVLSYAVEESIPEGLVVSNISHDGSFDAEQRKVKFGPFLDATPRVLQYTVSAAIDGSYTVSGVASFDGFDFAVDGPDTMQIVNALPHPADTDANFSISIAEVTAYGAAWKSGSPWPEGPNPIPIGYVTRAGYLWRSGEAYTDIGVPADQPQRWVPVD